MVYRRQQVLVLTQGASITFCVPIVMHMGIKKAYLLSNSRIAGFCNRHWSIAVSGVGFDFKILESFLPIVFASFELRLIIFEFTAGSLIIRWLFKIPSIRLEKKVWSSDIFRSPLFCPTTIATHRLTCFPSNSLLMDLSFFRSIERWTLNATPSASPSLASKLFKGRSFWKYVCISTTLFSELRICKFRIFTKDPV